MNILDRYNQSTTQFSKYDSLSIMQYSVDPRLTKDGSCIRINITLSETDKSYIHLPAATLL